MQSDRRKALLGALTDLHRATQLMAQKSGFYEPHAMAQLIGKFAVKLLSADIVTIHQYDQKSDRTASTSEADSEEIQRAS
jgi:hypothetical protein